MVYQMRIGRLVDKVVATTDNDSILNPFKDSMEAVVEESRQQLQTATRALSEAQRMFGERVAFFRYRTKSGEPTTQDFFEVGTSPANILSSRHIPSNVSVAPSLLRARWPSHRQLHTHPLQVHDRIFVATRKGRTARFGGVLVRGCCCQLICLPILSAFRLA